MKATEITIPEFEDLNRISIYFGDDEIATCWYNDVGHRCLLSLWLDDHEGVYTEAYAGRVVESVDIDSTTFPYFLRMVRNAVPLDPNVSLFVD